MKELKLNLWRYISLPLSFKSFWSSLTRKSLEKGNTWKIFFTVSMPSWFLVERWSEKLLTTASTVLSTRLSNSMGLPSYSTSLLPLFPVSQFPSENNTSFSSRMSSFPFIKFKLPTCSMNTWWDAPCSSWQKIPLLVFSCWMAFLSIGPSLTLQKKLCSFRNWLRCLKLVKLEN